MLCDFRKQKQLQVLTETGTLLNAAKETANRWGSAPRRETILLDNEKNRCQTLADTHDAFLNIIKFFSECPPFIQFLIVSIMLI